MPSTEALKLTYAAAMNAAFLEAATAAASSIDFSDAPPRTDHDERHRALHAVYLATLGNLDSAEFFESPELAAAATHVGRAALNAACNAHLYGRPIEQAGIAVNDAGLQAVRAFVAPLYPLSDSRCTPTRSA